MNMLKEMEERRQREREEDKKERKVVPDDIKDGVKKEMQEIMKPWQGRTVRVEESTAKMGEEVKRLSEEMRELREQLITRNQSYASVTGGGGTSSGALTGTKTVPISNNTNTVEDTEEKERICSLLSSARRVVGLKPIDKKHVEHVKRRLEEVEGETEVEKEERAKKGAVMMFLKHEMCMKKEDIEKLGIVKIFAPARDYMLSWPPGRWLSSPGLSQQPCGEEQQGRTGLRLSNTSPKTCLSGSKPSTALATRLD